MINKTFMKQPVVIPPQTNSQNPMGQARIFQIDKNEEVYVAADLEMIYMGGVKDHNNIIIDTGSAYNLIGHHLVPLLKQRIEEAGSEMSIFPTKKTFWWILRLMILCMRILFFIFNLELRWEECWEVPFEVPSYITTIYLPFQLSP